MEVILIDLYKKLNYWSLICTGRLAPVLKTIFINVSYHILVASLTLMALF